MAFSFSQMIFLFKILLLGMAVSLIISPFAIKFAEKVNLIDTPGSSPHKKHSQKTPLAGGVVIFISSVIVCLFLFSWISQYKLLFLSILIIFIFGLLDDLKGFTASQKFVGQILALVLLIYSGIQVRIFGDTTTLILGFPLAHILNWLITGFWVIGITNSFNLIDSMDGLALGIAKLALTSFMIMALVADQTSLATFCAIFIGICVGLGYFNTIPARLFLGDSGAQMLGFVIAVIAILYTPYDQPQASSWFVPIMVVAIPIFDTSLVVISRVRRHRNLFQGELNHTYHRLLAIGLPPNRALFAIHLTSLALSLLGFIALSLDPLMATLVFLLTCLVGFLGVWFLETKVHLLEDSIDE